MELEESVVRVTGAGRGSGRAVALALAGEGVHVALMGLIGTHLLAVETDVHARRVRSAVLPGDVSGEGSVSRCVAAAEEPLGPIDVLSTAPASTRTDRWTGSTPWPSTTRSP